jgi:hypothetical protein
MSELDRMKDGLAAWVRSLFSRLDYLALYPSRVVSQNGDGTLELQPDDPRLPGLSGVPVRLGLPGTTVEVQAGARVLLGFEAGDPARPVATLWEGGPLAKLTVVAATELHVDGGSELHLTAGKVLLKEGATPVAKEGSATTGHQHTLTGTAGPYPISGSAVMTTDTIAAGAGSPNVKVP